MHVNCVGPPVGACPPAVCPVSPCPSPILTQKPAEQAQSRSLPSTGYSILGTEFIQCLLHFQALLPYSPLALACRFFITPDSSTSCHFLLGNTRSVLHTLCIPGVHPDCHHHTHRFFLTLVAVTPRSP